MSDAEILQTSLAGGLDETNEDAFVPPSAMRVCQNVVFPDETTVQKRAGIHTGASLNWGRKLFTRGDEMLVTDGLNAYTVEGTNLYARGRVSPCTASSALFAPMSYQQDKTGDFPIVPLGSIGFDPTTKLEVRAWSDGKAVVAQVYDTVTGANLGLPTSLNDTAGTLTGKPIDNPRVCIVGSVAFVIYFDTNNPTHLYYRALDLTNVAGGWGAAVALGNFVAGNPMVWDASVVTGASMIALLTCVDGTKKATLNLYSAAATVLTLAGGAIVETVVGTMTFSSAAVRGLNADNQVAVAYAYVVNGAGLSRTEWLQWAVYDTAAGLVQGVTNMTSRTYDMGADSFKAFDTFSLGLERLVGQGAGNTAQWVVVEAARYRGPVTGSRDIPCLNWYVRQTTGLGLVRGYGPHLGYQQVSKPYLMTIAGASKVYALCEFASGVRPPANIILLDPITGVPNGNQTLVLMEIPWDSANQYAAPVPCAVVSPLEAGDLPSVNFDAYVDPTGTKLIAIGAEADQSKATSLSRIAFDFNSPVQYQAVALGNWTFLSGGVVQIYDGSQLCEVGFLTPPLQPDCVLHGGGGISTNPTMQYCIVEVQQDAAGNVHYGPPSNIVQFDASASGGTAWVDVYISPRRTTFRQAVSSTLGDIGANPIRLRVYRNTQATPSVFQLVAEIQNDPTNLGMILFQDFVTDGQLAGRPLLYTNGGAVESDMPPSLTALSVHADRVVGIADDGRTMYFTSEYVRGECPRFSAAFTIDWPEGPITATWSLEQRLHAATSRAIFFLIGEGPTIGGVGVDWTAPQKWQDGLGVNDARGVHVFELGALLATPKGLYLEGRDGSFTWLRKCRRTAANYPYVTSIVELPGDGVLRIACNFTPSIPNGQQFTQGNVLHWDYRKDRWATHPIFAGAVATGADDQAIAGGVYQRLSIVNIAGTVIATVAYETPGISLDALANTWVPIKLQTGWFDIAGLQGSVRVSRVLVMAQYYTNHTLTIRTGRDRANGFDADPGVFSGIAIATGSLEQARHTPTQQKMMSLSVAIEDSAPQAGGMGLGQGPGLQSLAVRGRPHRGEWKRLSAGQQG